MRHKSCLFFLLSNAEMLKGGAKEGGRMWGKCLRQNSADFKIWLTQVLIPPRETSLKTCWLSSICSLKLSGPQTVSTHSPFISLFPTPYGLGQQQGSPHPASLLDFAIWTRDCLAAANNWDRILPSQVNKHPSQTQSSLQLWSAPPPNQHKKTDREREGNL